jgi:hypothetical protein
MWDLLSPIHPEGGINLPFIIFTAIIGGIVIVWQRYEDIQSRAVPFHWPAPDVCPNG